ncbi:PRC-barrel domain-containing protein [uncultured Marivita sp.]|uniref:PRC-barrel domain-containing protein n=1 Tax=uncultured Marivita sp. TaxID=888080 RepID=UPI002638A07C|nr:PRC-barrel domain-containing protein [uncultured Marivita sp.]
MTSKTFLTTTALSLLLTTSAFAQSDSTATETETENAPIIEGAGEDTTMAPDATEDTMATDDMATDTMDMEAPQSISDMTVGEFLGLDVVSSGTGEDVGEIDYVIQGASEPEAVIGIGGFLGLGEYTVALPLSDFSYDAEDRTLMVNRTREELEAMPEFDESGVEGLEDDVELSTLMQDDTGMSTSGTTTGMTDDATSTDGMTEDSTMEEGATESDTMSTDGTETDGTEETGSEDSGEAEEDATSNN